jgi:Ca2+/H+ antiporter
MLHKSYYDHVNLTFTGPCMVIYSYSITDKMHLLSQIIYSCKTLYMFRAVFPSNIRSSKLRIQHRQTAAATCCYLG